MAEPKTPDEYHEQLLEEQRAPMAQIRAAIRAVAPDADEVLSYRMPAFKSDGRILVYYAAFRDHYSLYPFTPAVVEALGDADRTVPAEQGDDLARRAEADPGRADQEGREGASPRER